MATALSAYFKVDVFHRLKKKENNEKKVDRENMSDVRNYEFGKGIIVNKTEVGFWATFV